MNRYFHVIASVFGSLLLLGCDHPALTVGNETSSSTALVTNPNQISATSANVRVIDADTIALSGIKVRLEGISAAERGHLSYRPGQDFVRQFYCIRIEICDNLNQIPL